MKTQKIYKDIYTKLNYCVVRRSKKPSRVGGGKSFINNNSINTAAEQKNTRKPRYPTVKSHIRYMYKSLTYYGNSIS